MTQTDPALRPIDVAERWRCSQAHVRTLIRSGKLPAFKIGNKLLRVSLSAVEEYERRQRITEAGARGHETEAETK
jgi:excisionase family DNA binding protein